MSTKLLLKPTSALKKFINELPDDWSLKTAGTKNTLLKKVKQEELDYSGVGARIDAHLNEKVTKQDLVDWEINREDKWGDKQLKASRNETSYDSTTIEGSDPTSYTEDLRRYHTASEETESGLRRNVSSHHGSEAPDYFAHSRYTVEPIGDVKNTRLVQEIQSDLHQNARNVGYQGGKIYEVLDNEGRHVGTANNQTQLKEFLREEAIVSYRVKKRTTGGVPDAPLKKNWARKEIERQILGAVDEGQGSIAIPLEGAKSELARAEGVQKWYETQIRSTLKKITKQIPGAEYKEVKTLPKSTKIDQRLTNDNNEVFDFVMENPDVARAIVGDEWDAVDPNLADDYSLELVTKVVNALMTVDAPAADRVTQEQFNRLYASISSNQPSAITYGQIVLPPTEKIASKELAEVATETKIKYKPNTHDFDTAFEEYWANWDAPALKKELVNELEKDYNYDITADVGKEAEFVSSLLGSATNDDINRMVPGFLDSITEQVSIKPDNLVWPELTPEVREVFKRWETPPTTLKEVNKLHASLPDKYVTQLTDAAYLDSYNKALQEKGINPFELRMEINDQLQLWHSNFAMPDLYQVIDEFGTTDLNKLTGDAKVKVDYLKLAMNKTDEVKFVKDNWKAITKEQKLPLTETKITPAKLKYPDWTKGFELYTVGALGVASTMTPEEAQAVSRKWETDNDPVGSALDQGMSPGGILEYLQTGEGLSEQEAKQALANSIQQKINQALAQDASPEAVQKHVQELYNPELFNERQNFDFGTEPDEIPGSELKETQQAANKNQLIPIVSSEQFDSESTYELAKKAENVFFEQSMILDLGKGYLFDDYVAMDKFKAKIEESNYAVANSLRSFGRNVEIQDGELIEIQEDGTAIPLSQGIWTDLGWDLVAAEKEIGLSIGGAVLASKLLSKRLALSKYTPGKLMGIALYTGADTLGAVTGATLGRGLDIASNAYATNQDLSLKFYAKHMQDAGVFELILGPAASMTFRGLAGLIKGVGRVGDSVLAGNIGGAQRALDKFSGLTQEIKDEIIARYRKVASDKLPKNKTKRELEVISQTQPNMEALVKEASQYDPALSMNLARTINTRAKDVIANVEKATPDNIGIVVKKELAEYEKLVGTNFGKTKQEAIKQVPKIYQFDIDKLAVKPYLKKVRQSIANPAIRKRVKLYLKNISLMGETRDFKSLLDLRRAMNNFKYNTKLRQHIDFKEINGIIKSIDNEIAKTVDNHLPNGSDWLIRWREANLEYSDMLKMRKNVLYKAITKAARDGGKQGQNTEVMIRALAKHVSDIDGTFMQVVGTLPIKKQKLVENAVLSHIVKKHTTGQKEGLQAIDFPALAEELASMSFTSVTARRNKRAVTILSDVFKNDVSLHNLSHTLHTTKGDSVMTADLVAKAHWSLMNKIWNRLQSMIPFNTNADYLALGINLEKVLRDPLDSKSVTKLLKLFPKDEAIADGVRQLALIPPEFGKPKNAPYVKMAKKGGPNVVKNGKYDRGIYWTTDINGLRHTESKAKIMQKEILPESIATEADIKNILQVEEVTPELIRANIEELTEKLETRGYYGFSIGHDIVMFAE